MPKKVVQQRLYDLFSKYLLRQRKIKQLQPKRQKRKR
jgi:hypothetical protein